MAIPPDRKKRAAAVLAGSLVFLTALILVAYTDAFGRRANDVLIVLGAAIAIGVTIFAYRQWPD